MCVFVEMLLQSVWFSQIFCVCVCVCVYECVSVCFWSAAAAGLVNESLQCVCVCCTSASLQLYYLRKLFSPEQTRRALSQRQKQCPAWLSLMFNYRLRDVRHSWVVTIIVCVTALCVMLWEISFLLLGIIIILYKGKLTYIRLFSIYLYEKKLKKRRPNQTNLCSVFEFLSLNMTDVNFTLFYFILFFLVPVNKTQDTVIFIASTYIKRSKNNK